MTTSASSGSGTAVAPDPSSDAKSGGPMRRDIGLIGLLFAGVGSIIGSGWLFGAMEASQLAGPAAIISWIAGAIMMLIIGLIYAELGTMFPISGGVIRFPHLAFGSFASFTMGWINWVAAAAVAPIEVEGALQYATKWAAFTKEHKVSGDTVHTLTPLGYFVAVLAMAAFVLINYFGVRWFARINNIAVWWKLAVIILVIVAIATTRFDTSNFHSHGFAPYGIHGVLTAIATGGIAFSYFGFRQGIELAGESSNPKRNVPIAVIGSLLLTGLIYVLLQIAFIGALHPKDLANGWANLNFADSYGPLAAIATVLGLGWLATILRIDAVISPADTGLVYTTVTGRITYAMAKNGNAPGGLARTTKRGVPLVALFVTFVVGLIVFLPFPSWQQLVGFITSATVLSFSSGPVVLAALRRELPQQERPFRVPRGEIIAFIAFYASNLIVYWAGWDINWKLFIAVGAGFVFLAIYHAVNHHSAPPLELRAGATWTLPWLAGLCLISYLGDYPEKSVGAGNRGIIGFGWGFLVILALSVVVWFIAMKVRLGTERVTAHVDETIAEAEDEDSELAGSGH